MIIYMFAFDNRLTETPRFFGFPFSKLLNMIKTYSLWESYIIESNDQL